MSGISAANGRQHRGGPIGARAHQQSHVLVAHLLQRHRDHAVFYVPVETLAVLIDQPAANDPDAPLGGAGVEPQPAISAMLTFAALALAASMNLHVHVVAMFASSFEVLPMGLFPLGLDVADWAVEHVAACFALAFSLSLPFVGGALLYNLALGVINRAMPQMMVAFVGAPAITLGTLAMMVLAVPVILSVWLALFEARLASPLGLAE